MTSTTASAPHNHFNCSRGCSPAPLTLADRQVITGRSIAVADPAGGWFCGDCLADLPAGSLGRLSHVCGQPADAKVGDTARYHGSLAEYGGSVWEVTHIDRRGLVLFDVDRALWNVSPASVTVIKSGASR
jgi:hypothetical protein